MPWLPNDIWDYGDNIANARLPKLRKYNQAISIIPIIQKLVGWRRNDLAHALFTSLPELTRAQILQQSPGIFGGPNAQNVIVQPVNSIGRRKGNVENRGEYAGGRQANDLSPSLYLPSLKAFLKGSMGNVYTGVLVCPGGFNVDPNNPNLGLPQPRDKEMIFLVANDPPSAAEQEADAIAEPYLNRQFQGGAANAPSGYASWDAQNNTMHQNNRPVVHGRANDGTTVTNQNGVVLRAPSHQGHEQLRRLIVNSNRYRGIIPDVPNPQNGNGMFIGFTVMKGGRDPGNVVLDNVYGWTSNSMNRRAFTNPTGQYLTRLNAKRQNLNGQLRNAQDAAEIARLQGNLNSLNARSRAQASDEFATKIKTVLDRLLTLQVNDNSNDPYFQSIIRDWGSINI